MNFPLTITRKTLFKFSRHFLVVSEQIPKLICVYAELTLKPSALTQREPLPYRQNEMFRDR